jgi:site-specific recombinase XerD
MRSDLIPNHPPTIRDAALRATSDDGLVALWLSKYRSENTKARYGTDAEAFRRFIGKQLQEVTTSDVLAFGESLTNSSAGTIASRLSGVKSLTAFARLTESSVATALTH